ncbi:N-acetyl-gamma-glutamyl-phosphate reductase [Flavobacteriaceae bacterium]|nr:N-acetyl-gamma-glutamyl-phosphate reductase [Flavobacteriaceae bacterium]MDC1285344.1 N-acetyl-gamma-glutamyl-phosphate reductase [Flavobacteriaceae bacterium]PTM00680.1 MAG: N-acetyl-gamma-glutamyl-phosphate reductase [Candidatus Arcticimaribacter sp.]
MKTAGIIGGSGYTGGELLRLVLNHPGLTLDFVYSTTRPGFPLSETHPDLLGSTSINFTDQVNLEVSVVFLCLGHGNSSKFLEQNKFSEQTLIIDLSNDFRLSADSEFMGRTFIYGLPERNKEAIEQATAIANPGCFATAIQLALLPLATAKKLTNSIHVNATTGSTGAGVGLSATAHFSWRNNNMSWYKPFTHQHLGEIGESINELQGSATQIHFLPQRGDFTRGIFATAYTAFDGSLEEAVALYTDYYANDPFTHVSKQEIALKQVINSNNCFLHLHLHEGTLLITSVIDNLIKGASGQAIQNMNLIYGWEEGLGLNLKASTF